MIRATTLATILCLGLLPLTAQRPRPTAPAPKADPARMAKHLGLNEAQQKQLQGILEQHKATLESKHAVARDAQQAFHQALRNPATEPATLKKLHDAAVDRQFEAFLEQRNQRQEVRALLTPEQREKAAFAMGRAEGRRGMMGAMEHRQHGFRQQGMGRGLARALNLSDEQIKQLGDLRKGQTEHLRELGRSAQEARKAFFEAAKDPSAKTADLQTMHRTLADRQFALMEAGRGQRQTLEKILTPEQKATWAKLQAERPARGPAGRGPGFQRR